MNRTKSQIHYHSGETHGFQYREKEDKIISETIDLTCAKFVSFF